MYVCMQCDSYVCMPLGVSSWPTMSESGMYVCMYVCNVIHMYACGCELVANYVRKGYVCKYVT